MQLTTRFNLGDQVRVVKDGGFVGTVTEIRVSVKDNEILTGYTVTIPEERRGRGRNYSESWGYREDWLEPA